MPKDANYGDRPSIFLSCVSSEFRTAREKVASSLRFMGYDVEYQESFPTDAGDLKQILRSKIDRCEGLIQIIGDAYGEEPLELDPDFGRVSYTQYELLYAQSQNKKIWMLHAGPENPRDNPVHKLDLPATNTDDAIEYRSERQALQNAYRQKLIGGHKRDNWQSEVELENLILRLRDDLQELREAYTARDRKVQSFLTSLLSRQKNTGLAIGALIATVIFGFLWMQYSTTKQIALLPTTQKKPKQFPELGENDVFIRANVMTSGGPGGNVYVVTVGPASEHLKYHFQNVSISVEADNKAIPTLQESPHGTNIVEYRSFTFKADSPPKTLSISLTSPNSETVGPFKYETDLQAQLDQRELIMESQMQQYGLGDMLKQKRVLEKNLIETRNQLLEQANSASLGNPQSQGDERIRSIQ